MNLIPRALLGVPLLTLAFLATGCGPKPCEPKAYNVTVELDNSLRERNGAGPMRTVPVDLIAVSGAEKDKWDRYSVSNYFKPGNETRGSARKYALQFDADHPAPKTLKANDPIWNDWKGSQYLYVLAYLPQNFEDQEGNKDPRRNWVPLGVCHWTGTDIKFIISAGGIKPTPPPVETKDK